MKRVVKSIGWTAGQRRLLAVALGLASGCRPAPQVTPEATFRAFSDAVRVRDVKKAFSLLSSKSRSTVEAAAKAVSEGSKGSLSTDAAALTFASSSRPASVLAIKVEAISDVSAVLEVHTCRHPPLPNSLDSSAACPKGEDVRERVTMVKEEQRWAIVLPELVKP
jgi:hypothetical protein